MNNDTENDSSDVIFQALNSHDLTWCLAVAGEFDQSVSILMVKIRRNTAVTRIFASIVSETFSNANSGIFDITHRKYHCRKR